MCWNSSSASVMNVQNKFPLTVYVRKSRFLSNTCTRRETVLQLPEPVSIRSCCSVLEQDLLQFLQATVPDLWPPCLITLNIKSSPSGMSNHSLPPSVCPSFISVPWMRRMPWHFLPSWTKPRHLRAQLLQDVGNRKAPPRPTRHTASRCGAAGRM